MASDGHWRTRESLAAELECSAQTVWTYLGLLKKRRNLIEKRLTADGSLEYRVVLRKQIKGAKTVEPKPARKSGADLRTTILDLLSTGPVARRELIELSGAPEGSVSGTLHFLKGKGLITSETGPSPAEGLRGQATYRLAAS